MRTAVARPWVRLVAALAAGVVVSWAVSSCGSGGSGTIAQTAKEAVSTAATQAERPQTTTAPKPQRTTTGSAATTTQAQRTTTTAPETTTTQPEKTNGTTATEQEKPKVATTTTQPPAVTVTTTAPTTVTQAAPNATVTGVVVAPTSTTGNASGDGELPWWGWALIALVVVGIAVAIFQLGRRRGGQKSNDTYAQGPDHVANTSAAGTAGAMPVLPVPGDAPAAPGSAGPGTGHEPPDPPG